MRAIDKVKLKLTGSTTEPLMFQHQGPHVVHWISPDKGPDARVLFKDVEDKIAALCPNCKQELGRFNADYGRGTSQQLSAICEAASLHHCQQ